MLSPSIHKRSDARLAPLASPAIAPPILPRNLRSARSRVRAQPCFAARRSEQTRRPNLLQPYAAVKSPRSPLHPQVPHPPRFRASALFGRRPHQRVEEPVIAGVRKPAQEATYAVQQVAIYSITSSAVASSAGGMVRPSVLPVWALMTSSNLLDWTTGRSVGLAPMRMRPA
jgi:hypothetical protein